MFLEFLLGAGYGSYGYGGNSATAGYSKCLMGKSRQRSGITNSVLFCIGKWANISLKLILNFSALSQVKQYTILVKQFSLKYTILFWKAFDGEGGWREQRNKK